MRPIEQAPAIYGPTSAAPAIRPASNLLSRAFAARLLTVALLLFINGVVFRNAIITPGTAGYDSKWHIKYAEVLSRGRLPQRYETVEFFSPPLTYELPSIARAILHSDFAAAKVGQLQNVFFSIALTLLVVKFAQRLRPDEPFAAPTTLMLLAILPVYYKSFAFFRGEPLLAPLVLSAVYILYKSDGALEDAFSIGLIMGFGMLARQWAAFVIIALGLYGVVARRWRWTHLLVAALVIALIAGWFYFTQFIRYGTLTAFNRSERAEGQPLSFYIGTGSGALFTAPVRPAFDNQLLPILYSETWGDYWTFWTKDKETLLARMNIVGLLPTVVIGIALIRGWRRRELRLLYLVIATSIIGYLAFLIRYPNEQGDTIKATYMLHLFPLVALIAAHWLAKYWYVVMLVGAALIVHNWPLFSWRGM